MGKAAFLCGINVNNSPNIFSIIFNVLTLSQHPEIGYAQLAMHLGKDEEASKHKNEDNMMSYSYIYRHVPEYVS